MFTSDEDASLTNIGQGAAIEKFDHELNRVLEDLADVNKNPSDVRKITLVLTLKPTPTQGIIETTIEVNPAMGKRKPFGTHLMIGREGGRMKAHELMKQRPLPLGVPGSTEKVVDIYK